jgi:hypothetical protein
MHFLVANTVMATVAAQESRGEAAALRSRSMGRMRTCLSLDSAEACQQHEFGSSGRLRAEARTARHKNRQIPEERGFPAGATRAFKACCTGYCSYRSSTHPGRT